MSNLPKLKTLSFEIEIPTTGKKLKFHQYSVKEEKLLVTVKESSSTDDITNAMAQVIKNCCMDKIDIDSLSITADIPYIFTMLRAKSSGEMIEISVNEPHESLKKDVVCEPTEIKIDLNKTRIVRPEKINTIIELDANTKLKLKNIGIKDIHGLSLDSDNDAESYESLLLLIVRSMESIIEGDTIYDIRDYREEELLTWITENLNSQHIHKIKDFFENVPTIELDVEYKCKTCGKKIKKTLKDLKSFF